MVDKKRQVEIIRERLEKRGISSDLVDVFSLVDSEVSLEDNWETILEEIGNYNTPMKEIVNNLKGEELQQQKVNIFNSLSANIICLDKYLKDYRTMGVVGSRNTSKSSLVLYHLFLLREKYPELDIWVFGAEPQLHAVLIERGIKIIYNKEDILDLKIENSLIYIDEFADIFSVNSKDKQLDRIKRFFNRINHLNDWVIISTAQANFWNKFVCGLIDCFLVKEIEYDLLVNGTKLKRKIMGLPSGSDYRFECSKETYFTLTDEITEKHIFPYIEELDSKKNNINYFKVKQNVHIFDENYGKFCGKNYGEKNGTKDETKGDIKTDNSSLDLNKTPMGIG